MHASASVTIITTTTMLSRAWRHDGVTQLVHTHDAHPYDLPPPDGVLLIANRQATHTIVPIPGSFTARSHIIMLLYKSPKQVHRSYAGAALLVVRHLVNADEWTQRVVRSVLHYEC